MGSGIQFKKYFIDIDFSIEGPIWGKFPLCPAMVVSDRKGPRTQSVESDRVSFVSIERIVNGPTRPICLDRSNPVEKGSQRS